MERDSIFEIINTYSPNNKKITNETYTTRIFYVLKNCDINNVENTLEYLEKRYSQKTFKSFLTSIVVFTKATKQDILAEKYGKKMKEINDLIQNKEKTHVPTESEKQNMVTKNEIQTLINEIKNQIDNMEVKENYYNYFDIYKKYLVLNLYYLIPPIRNDYVGCEVYQEQIGDMKNNINYIFIKDKKLILNRYKTSRKYGQGLQIDLPESLVNIIKNWITIRSVIYPKLLDVRELLLNKNLKPMSQVNLTQFLNRIFQKNVSSTILRKSYLTEKYPVTQTITEMEKDAKSMQHSVNTQQQTYRKKT